MSSKDGLYNRKTSILNLNHNVIVKSSSGFEMHLEEAVVDTANGEVVSNKPVSVFTQDATLNADRLEIQKSGEIVRFIGNVVMNLDNVGKPAPAPAPQPRRRNDERQKIRAKTINAAFIAAVLAATMPCAVAQSRAGKTSAPASPPAADSGTSVPNALQGFQQNRGQPVQIEAARLEVRDKDKVATFTGNVKVVQGDTTMHCKVLVVFYEKKDEAQAQAPSRSASPARRCRPRRRAPAARRRSAGWKPTAAWPSPRRTRPPPATPACST